MNRAKIQFGAMTVSRVFALGILFIGGLLIGACTDVAGSGPSFASKNDASVAGESAAARVAEKYIATSSPGSAGYLVGPQDILDITVFNAPELSRAFAVAENGTLNLPLVGQVRASGKTPAQIEHDIEGRLNARYMKSSQVTVLVKEYNSQRVTLEGAVRTPGVVPLHGDHTLREVIARAGGLDRTISSSDVVVFRTVNGGRTMARFDLSAIAAGDAEDPQVMPGDVIVVEDSMAKTGLQYLLKLVPLASFARPLF